MVTDFNQNFLLTVSKWRISNNKLENKKWIDHEQQ